MLQVHKRWYNIRYNMVPCDRYRRMYRLYTPTHDGTVVRHVVVEPRRKEKKTDASSAIIHHRPAGGRQQTTNMRLVKLYYEVVRPTQPNPTKPAHDDGPRRGRWRSVPFRSVGGRFRAGSVIQASTGSMESNSIFRPRGVKLVSASGA